MKITKGYILITLFLAILFSGMLGCAGKDEDFLEELPLSLEEEETAETEPSEMPEAAIEKIYVDVCGAVVNPGVYILDADSRVYHAIEAAGGFCAEAAETFINRAQSISDGQQIYVPTKEEMKESSHIFADEIQSEELADSKKVNINNADAEILMTLPGVGESKAQSIIQYREEHGAFSNIEDIMNVPGIKDSVFTKIKDNIDVK